MKATTILPLSLLPALSTAQSLCDQFSYHSSHGFYLNNNEWGSASGYGSQCTYVNTIDYGGVSWSSEWSWSGGDYNVKSYPYSGRYLDDNKRIVSSISSIQNEVNWSYEGDGIRANVAYDLFTAADPGHEISSGDYELMIWLARLGDVYPIGNSVGFIDIGGRSWELYVGYNGAMKVFTFVAPSPINFFDSDIKPFFDHITDNQGFPADSQHLITLQFGTEPFTGQIGKFIVNKWYGSVE